MTTAILFLSTRQLTQVDFSLPLLGEHDLILVASKQELDRLPDNISSHFTLQFPVSISADDGVIIEYVYNEIVEIVASIRQSYSTVDFVCFDEGNVELADSLRQNSKSNQNLERFRDKVEMKKWLKKRNIPTPFFIETISENQRFDEISSKVGTPFVVKPKRSAGSNNIYIIRSKDDFLEVQNTAAGSLSNYEAEEYINGDLYHCDIALWMGESIFAECTEYLCPTIDFQSGSPLGGRVMDTNSPLREQLIEFAKVSLKALESSDGVYHMEIFVRNNDAKDLVFLEVGARPPGMLVTTMYEKATGVNLLNLDIMIQTRSVPNDFSFSRKKHAFYLVYPKRNGRVQALNTPSNHCDIEMNFVIHSVIGEQHQGCFSNLDFCAFITCSAVDKAEIDSAYQYMSEFKPVQYAS
ncbi:ATP-grasp domain-containing protein [Photobacterium halotolerans]|uniref:Biotin carboxylase n=1 Tax=Photobacterium halotolerans TaxID=265726 RepID=A0A0F5VEF6_9GAMM|nr:ATP-grasp domain-containing protein [Photobacterium halotolerans]KKD00463.1 biotin carboxylase [Photobacterium halotolerans]